MTIQTEQNRDKAEKIIYSLLNDTGFCGYKYDTYFTLKFNRLQKSFYEGHLLHGTIEIQVLSNWWVDSKVEWQSKIENLSANQLVEPIEPVRAYELTCIRG